MEQAKKAKEKEDKRVKNMSKEEKKAVGVIEGKI